MRRLARAGALALVVLGGGVAAQSAAAAGLHVRDRLVLVRPDGTRVAVRPEFRVWCGPWASDVPVPSIHVVAGRRSASGRSAWWEMHAVLADVRRHPVVRLPNTFVFDHPHGAQLFAVDRRNELNTDTDESRGRIRFLHARCGPRLRVAFRMSGRAGSELSDGTPLEVHGSFSASSG